MKFNQYTKKGKRACEEPNENESKKKKEEQKIQRRQLTFPPVKMCANSALSAR